jgi:hypothetical protein
VRYNGRTLGLSGGSLPPGEHSSLEPGRAPSFSLQGTAAQGTAMPPRLPATTTAEQSVPRGATRRCPECHDGTEFVAENPDKTSQLATVWNCRAWSHHTELIGVPCRSGDGRPSKVHIALDCALCRFCIDHLANCDEDELDEACSGWTPPLRDRDRQREIRSHCEPWANRTP